MLFKPFFVHNKNARKTRILFRNAKAKKLTMWQPRAFKLVRDERFSVIQAFCGSGKTVLQIALAIYDIITSGFTQKQLIAVPCNHIGNGFAKERIKIGKRIFDWLPSANFTEHSLAKTEALKRWVLATPKQLKSRRKSFLINGLGAVCSQKALVLVWNGRPGFRGLTKSEKRRAIRNLTLRVDEAHHIKQSGTDPALIENELTAEQLAVAKEEANGLGKIIDYITSSEEETVKLCFTTATFFRGDSCPIILEKARKQFAFFHLDWLEHWLTLGISKLTFEYVEYDKDPIGLILEIIRKNPRRRFLVIVPPRGHKWRVKGRIGEARVRRLAQELKKLGSVCDLVVRPGLTWSQQKANKRLLLEEPKDTSRKPKFDIVLSCNLVREGTDWVPCDFILNAAVESSPTVAVQTLGRPFRRYKVKKEVTICTLVKKFVVPKDSSLRPREILSDRTNMLLVLTMLHDMAYPTKLYLPTAKKKSGPSGPKTSTLEAIYGQHYHKILRELFESFEMLVDKTEKSIDIVIESIMDKYPTHDEHRKIVPDALKVRLLRHFKPPSIRCFVDQTYLRRNGFDKIVQGKSLYFGELSKKDLRDAYTLIRGGYSDFYEGDYVGFIKKVA